MGNKGYTDKAREVLPKFFEEYKCKYIPLNYLRKFLARYGIPESHTSQIILTLSADGSIYTYTGGNEKRAYIIRDPKHFDERDFLITTKDPVYLTYLIMDTLQNYKPNSYISPNELYKETVKRHPEVTRKELSSSNILHMLIKAGYVMKVGNKKAIAIRPSPSMPQYPTIENAKRIYKVILDIHRQYIYASMNKNKVKVFTDDLDSLDETNDTPSPSVRGGSQKVY